MKAFSVFRRSLRQNLRDRFGLALTLLTAPLFVVFYWTVFDESAEPIDVCIAGDALDVGEIAALADKANSSLNLVPCAKPQGDDLPQRGGFVVRAELGSMPEQGPVEVVFRGDASDPTFATAVSSLQLVIDSAVAIERGEPPRLRAKVAPTPGTDGLTPFDLYVPNLLIFALIMLVFSTAMTVAREIERGTLERLRLTRMRTHDYLAGIAATQLVLGAGSIVATLGTAVALGFEVPGSLPLAGSVAFVTAIACVGIGVLTASFARTVSRAFVVSSFFMFLLVLFSGLVFPLPDAPVFEVIPTVHGARALHHVLVLQADAPDIAREFGALAVLSLGFFTAGGLRFAWLHRTFLQGGP